MSHNKVWVTWEDPYNGKPLACKVQNLGNKADIDDLTQAFVELRQHLKIDPAKIKVHEREGGDRLLEDVVLQPYFVRKEDENNDNPGRSRRTALFLTLPNSTKTKVQEEMADNGTFFTPWNEVWTVESVHQQEYQGTRLERIAKTLANSNYNLLRAPHNHGNFYDTVPCWILVPACTVDELKGWKPENVYSVLAMACGCANIPSAKAYQNLCNGAYNDKVFDASTATNGKLTRSKCTEKQFANATENIKRMTLAMAETLVGKGDNVRPNNGLEGAADNLTETEYESIAQRLKAKTTKQTAEELHYNKNFGPKIFNAVQYSETIKSLDRDGIKVPQAKEGVGVRGQSELWTGCISRPNAASHQGRH